MTTRCLVRCLSFSTRQCFTTALSRASPTSLRPLVAAASVCYVRRLVPGLSFRGFATRQTSSSLNDPNPNWSNRPPKETILLDGCDFEHWLVVLEKPENDPTRDEIIDSYIKTLAMVVGSEEEARMKIYSVSTRHYFAFGALVSEELSYKLKELPKVRWVLPDSYLDVRNKDYGGEPFINGQAVPYDPKYHEEWVRNNARANERNRRNDRPRNFDRSRNFERRRDMQMNNQNSGGNFGGPSGNMGPPPNLSAAPNMATPPSAMPNTGPAQQPPNNVGGPPDTFGARPQYPTGMGGGQTNYHGVPPNNMGGQAGYGGAPYQANPGPIPNNVNTGNYPSNSMRGMPNNAPNIQYGSGVNSGGTPYQSGPGPNPYNFPPNTRSGPGPNQNAGSGPSPNSYGPNTGFGPGPNEKSPGYGGGQHLNNYAPNGQYQNGYNQNTSSGNPYQNQNLPGRDTPTNY